MLKFAINGMVGKFKPKPTENWTSLCVQENPNDVFITFFNKTVVLLRIEPSMIRHITTLTKNMSLKKMRVKALFIIKY